MQTPRVIAKPDNLNTRNVEFDQAPLTVPLFLNSVPKSGSHLFKNIMRMFVPVEQQYSVDFIQYPTLQQHHNVFSETPPKLSWGHLLFADSSSILLKNVRHILLVRDPYDWVLARARFFLSDNFQAGLDYMKHGRVDINDFLNMMIFPCWLPASFEKLAVLYWKLGDSLTIVCDPVLRGATVLPRVKILLEFHPAFNTLSPAIIRLR